MITTISALAVGILASGAARADDAPPAPASAETLRSGLIAYWRMDEPAGRPRANSTLDTAVGPEAGRTMAFWVRPHSFAPNAGPKGYRHINGEGFNYTDADIGPVAIWSRVLAPEERALYWNGGKGVVLETEPMP